MDIDRTAPVVVRQEMLIDAPVELLWRLHTDVNRWTEWRSDVDSASLASAFAPGEVFHWRTGGLEVESTIEAVDPLRRTAWGGPAAGITGIHVWTFTPSSEGVHVVTEESWAGEPIEADVAKAQSMLETAISTWLHELRQATQNQSQSPGPGTTAPSRSASEE